MNEPGERRLRPRRGVHVTARDTGPGIPDVEAALSSSGSDATSSTVTQSGHAERDARDHDRGVARYALDHGNAERLWTLGAGYVT